MLASVSVVLWVMVEELARTLVELVQLSSPRVRVASVFEYSLISPKQRVVISPQVRYRRPLHCPR